MLRLLFAFSLLLCPIFHCPAFAQEANDEFISMVINFLKQDDEVTRTVALEQIRGEAKGEQATKRFAAELANLKGESQIALLRALAARGDTAAKPEIIKLLSTKAPTTLQVAIEALGNLGDASDTTKLVSFLKSEQTKSVARAALQRLQGQGVNGAIAQAIKGNAVANQVELIQILTARRATDEIPTLLNLAKGRDPKLRSAAMKSLGQLASPQHVPDLVEAVLIAKKGNERNDAEKNLMFVCKRNSNVDEQASPILKEMKQLNKEQSVAILPALGRVGGKDAWTEVKKALGSRDSGTYMAGIRAISNWPDASVSDELIKLAKQGRHPDHRRIARMSLLRVAPLPDGRSDTEKLELLKTAMELAANEKEKKYGIKRAGAIRIVETLRYLLPMLGKRGYAQEACNSIVELAHHRELRDNNKGEFHAALDRVIAESKDATTVERAKRYKAGKTWVRE